MIASGNLAFLPHAGTIWLCAASGETVTPLAPAPGGVDAVWRLSEDGTEFGNIDQGGKRIAHYKVLDQAPWIAPLKSPLALPRKAIANDLVIHQGQVIVGGHSRDGEALWLRDRVNDRLWHPIPLPKEVRARGKSVDALFVRGSALVAIDNMKIPKWILVYDLNQPLHLVRPQVVPLTTHTTYEQVHVCAEGDTTYALFSIGINHGNAHFYISLLDKYTLKEIGKWSWDKPRDSKFNNWSDIFTNLDVPEHEEKLETQKVPFYESLSGMRYCCDFLMLACGDDGLYIGQVPESPEGSTAALKLSEFRNLHLKRLKSAMRIEHAFDADDGAYVIGLNGSGSLDYEWVSKRNMEEIEP